MAFKTLLPVFASGMAALLLVSGCKKDAAALGDQNGKLFQSAPANIKSEWDKATAALATNGYFTAITSFQKLQQAQLSPDQLRAVNETVTAVSEQMYEAVNKGDPAAVKAVEDLRKASGR